MVAMVAVTIMVVIVDIVAIIDIVAIDHYWFALIES